MRSVLFFLLLTIAGSANALKIEDIPTPRPQGWVTDQAGLFSAETVAEINRLIDRLHTQRKAELAVVTVGTIGGGDHRDFATRLFNHWGIGAESTDNGILILVAIDDRAAELILGDGIDTDAEVAVSDSIMQNEMVPRFRSGDAEGAVLAGVRASIERIYHMPLTNLDAPIAQSFALRLDRDASADSTYSPPAAAHGDATRSDSRGAAAEPTGLLDRLLSMFSDYPVYGAAGGAGVLGGAWLGVRAYLRGRPRRCPRCPAMMQRMSEDADDQHLQASETLEERLGSVDYDIWACPSCNNVVKLRYGAFLTRYAKCPSCHAVTKNSVETTLTAATYDHGGRVRVDETCENCGYKNSTTKTTARKQRSSSSSGSSGFSGGSSSGRGSSGRW